MTDLGGRVTDGDEHGERRDDPSVVLEQARAVLMRRLGCSREAALALLVARAEREQVTVRDVAARVVAGAEPDEGERDGGGPTDVT